METSGLINVTVFFDTGQDSYDGEESCELVTNLNIGISRNDMYILETEPPPFNFYQTPINMVAQT